MFNFLVVNFLKNFPYILRLVSSTWMRDKFQLLIFFIQIFEITVIFSLRLYNIVDSWIEWQLIVTGIIVHCINKYKLKRRMKNKPITIELNVILL